MHTHTGFSTQNFTLARAQLLGSLLDGIPIGKLLEHRPHRVPGLNLPHPPVDCLHSLTVWSFEQLTSKSPPIAHTSFTQSAWLSKLPSRDGWVVRAFHLHGIRHRTVAPYPASRGRVLHTCMYALLPACVRHAEQQMSGAWGASTHSYSH